MPQLDILYHQVKPHMPAMGNVLLSCWTKGFHRPLKYIGYCQGHWLCPTV